jgi:hypothetical protein
MNLNDSPTARVPLLNGKSQIMRVPDLSLVRLIPLPCSYVDETLKETRRQFENYILDTPSLHSLLRFHMMCGTYDQHGFIIPIFILLIQNLAQAPAWIHMLDSFKDIPIIKIGTSFSKEQVRRLNIHYEPVSSVDDMADYQQNDNGDGESEDDE